MRRFTREEIEIIRRDILVLSQTEFSAFLGISQPYYSQVVGGSRPISENMHKKIYETVERFIDMESLESLLIHFKERETNE